MTALTVRGVYYNIHYLGFLVGIWSPCTFTLNRYRCSNFSCTELLLSVKFMIGVFHFTAASQTQDICYIVYRGWNISLTPLIRRHRGRIINCCCIEDFYLAQYSHTFYARGSVGFTAFAPQRSVCDNTQLDDNSFPASLEVFEHINKRFLTLSFTLDII